MKPTYKPSVTTARPVAIYTGTSYPAPVYSSNDHKKCPWWNAHYGDCGANYPEKCSLKYFRVCGEYFFNKVYADVCRWQDAKQLIPMFTEKLVPLGYKFESETGNKCNGYSEHNSYTLYGRELPAEGKLSEFSKDYENF